MLRKIREFIDAPKRLQRAVDKLEVEVDTLKSRMDLDDDLLDKFYEVRQTPSYEEVYTKPDPLVSVCISTYNRAQLLMERSLGSVLKQTYTNIELIVIGDGCTDETAECMARIGDDRVRFENLPERGRYPADPHLRWMVAGTGPDVLALELAQGDFITHLDDDDVFASDRIEKLVRFIRETKADLVWHPFWRENNRGQWSMRECPQFAEGQVTTSSIFYHRWLRCIPWSLDAYRYKEPGDWNRFRKFKYIGVRAERYPEPLLWHYMERSQQNLA